MFNLHMVFCKMCLSETLLYLSLQDFPLPDLTLPDLTLSGLMLPMSRSLFESLEICRLSSALSCCVSVSSSLSLLCSTRYVCVHKKQKYTPDVEKIMLTYASVTLGKFPGRLKYDCSTSKDRGWSWTVCNSPSVVVVQSALSW